MFRAGTKALVPEPWERFEPVSLADIQGNPSSYGMYRSSGDQCRE
jgi:hypothetical protein